MTLFRRIGFFLLLLVFTGCGVNPAERNAAGIAAYNQGDYASSLRAYQAAQVSAPDQAEPYFNAASAYAQSNDLDKALAALQQALKTADNDVAAQAYYNLGNVYFALRRFPEAVQAYQQALLRHPDDEDARHNLELALKQIVAPTPTPDLQDATPTPDQGEGQATSTPPPDAVTPTPPPQENNSPSDQSPGLENTMTAEDAESLLDGIRRDQHTLQEYLATPAASSEKDW